MNLKSLFCLVFLALGCTAFSQNKIIDSLIKVKASSFFIDELNIPDAIVYTKTNGEQVYIEHRGIKMWCDQALLYKTDNFIRALGNVRMNQGDTLTMVSEFAEYNGTSQLAFANGNVKMTNPDTTLETDSLFFDRNKQQAYYRSGGTVRDTASTLRSRIGRYFIKENKYQFLDQVVVTNKEYTINSNHLNFYSETGHAYLYGPSTITSTTSKVYCERGFYDTRKDIGHFVKNSKIDYENRTIWGDSLYFDRNRSFASATNNIIVLDTLNNSIINGHYAEVFRKKDSVFITKRAVAISTQDQDSVYIHADTLMVTGPEDQRVIRGFYDARLFKKDLSGKADSIVSIQSKGITKMITNPILWSNNSQITGDSIFLYGNNKSESLDSLHVFYDAFMIDQDSSGGFNQIKGKELKGFFNDVNQIVTIKVDRNVENLIYSRDEDNLLIGINKGTSGRMVVDFEDRAIVMITTLDNPEDKTYPPEEFPENVRKLRDFKWRGDEAMTSRNDLFLGKEPPVLPIIQGIPPPKIEIDFFESLKNVKVSDKSRIQKEELKTRTGDQTPQTRETLEPLKKEN
jgi:lipopolysaccharide export system protein LptA